MIKSLESLYKVVQTLRSEDGCPWDKAQTLESLDRLFLEECFELSEAIQDKDPVHITEELGDVSFMLFLMTYVAEQDNILDIKEVYKKAEEKLIFRHPHVFGDLDISSPEEVLANWEELKKKEKSDRKSTFDGIPKTLPPMMRFDKLVRKLTNQNQVLIDYKSSENDLSSQLKNLLLDCAIEGEDLSSMLQKINLEIEQAARQKGL